MTTVTAGAGASASAPINTSGSHLLALFTGSTPSGTPTDTAFAVQTAGGQQVAFVGARFAGFGANGLPGSGVIDSMSIRDANGQDIAVFSRMLVAATNLTTAVSNGNVAALHYMFFAGASTLTGSAFDDVLAGNASGDVLEGGAGNDTLLGDQSNDLLDGGDGNDTLQGGNQDDTLRGNGGNDLLDGGADEDLLEGGAGDDTLLGGGGRDTLNGGVGNDNVDGGTGNDTLLADAGDDTLAGGDGSDTLSFADATAAVVASLAAGTASSAAFGSDTLAGIEKLIGGSGNDVLTGADGVASLIQPDLVKPQSLTTSQLNPLWLNDSFDLEANPEIAASTTRPHTTVHATAPNAGDFQDYYGFTSERANATLTIDIDATSPGFDSLVTLYRRDNNGSWNYVAANDDAFPADPGSSVGQDSYLTVTLSAPGDYFIAVSPWSSSSNTGISQYTLHVSLDGVALGSALEGRAGDDTLNGGAAAEALVGGPGADQVDGGAGNDIVVVDPGDLATAETMAGGAGIDTLRLGGAGNGAALDLSSHAVSGFEILDIDLASLSLSAAQVATLAPDLAIIDRHTNEAVTLRITGAAAGIDLSGWTLSGWEDWRDTIVIEGTATATAYIGSRSYEQVSYANAGAGITASLSSPVDNTGDAAGDSYVGIEQLTGTAHGDVLLGDAGVNALYGGSGNDLIYGGAGDDNLQSGDGDDIIEGGAGADFVDGGGGFDAASYAGAPSPVVRFLGGSGTFPGDAQGDVLFNIEALSGSAFADILGGAGGNDTLSGAGGSDWLLGLAGDDVLHGGAGNDVLNGGAGGDTLDGGAGEDVAWFRDAGAGVAASLATGGSGGEAASDSFAAVENLWGSDFGDTLAGDGAANQVYGFAGVDTLDGAGGDDILYGGDGADTLSGGAGADTFFFLKWQGEGGDTLTDFTSGVDRISVSRFWFGIDTTGPAAALQAGLADFLSSGGAVSALPTFYWNSATAVLAFDPDGLGLTPTFILATLQPGAALVLSDIWSG